MPQELKQEKHREHKAHRSAHPQRAGRAGAGRTHAPQPQHHADAPQAGQARHMAHHRTDAQEQRRQSTQHHAGAQHTEERTREYTRVNDAFSDIDDNKTGISNLQDDTAKTKGKPSLQAQLDALEKRVKALGG